jgi:hypothetical protein
MAKRKKVRNSWAASVLREVADRLATVDDCGSSSAASGGRTRPRTA